MHIEAVESSVVSLPFSMGGPHPLFAGQPWDGLEILLVRVETDDGLVGWGEAFGQAAIAATEAALDTIVAPLVVGRDAGDINGLTRQALHGVHLLGRNGPFVYAFSGVEIALWDLPGKRAGQPLWRILGGDTPARLDAYASLLSYGGDLELVARNAAQARARGYRNIKLHELAREAVRARDAATHRHAQRPQLLPEVGPDRADPLFVRGWRRPDEAAPGWSALPQSNAGDIQKTVVNGFVATQHCLHPEFGEEQTEKRNPCLKQYSSSPSWSPCWPPEASHS